MKKLYFQNKNEFIRFMFAFHISVISISSIAAQVSVVEENNHIKGKIITADSIAVPFVTVKIFENKRSAITDDNGNFYFDKLNAGIYHLIISGIGIDNISQEVIINGNTGTQVYIRINLSENQLQDVIIKTQSKSYSADESSSATRTNIALIDLPQSLEVITRQILKDRQALNLGEASKSLGSIVQLGSPELNSFSMRGFQADDGNYAYDGMQYSDFSNAFHLQELSYNIERIEFIKGPGSAIFGQGAPGGVINIVTKKPTIENRYEYDLTVGSYNQYRLVTDVSGALSKSKKILYRFINGYENSKALEKNQHIQNIFTNPQIEFRPNNKTSFRYSLQYYYDDRVIFGGNGIPALFDTVNQQYNLNAFTKTTSLNSPLGRTYTNKLFNQFFFTHKFSNKVKLTAMLLFLNYKHTLTTTAYTYPSSFMLTGDSIIITSAIEQIKHFSVQSSTFAEFKFNTGNISHVLVTGVDFSYLKERYVTADIEDKTVNILNPDFEWTALNFNELYKNLDQYPNSFSYKVESIKTSAYFNDFVNISKQWKMLLGVRFDYFRGVPNPHFPATNSLFTDTAKNSTFYPRAGLVWQPLTNISFYANYTRGFFPQLFSNKGIGGPFPPEKSVQYETGIKAELMHGNLLLTGAVFSIQKYNEVVDDTIPNKLYLLKHVYSKGIEFSAAGNAGKNISVTANYTLNIVKIESGETIFTSAIEQFPGAPKNIANAWIKYAFKKPSISIGTGYNYVSSRSTSTRGFSIPAYSIVDAAVIYNVRKFSIACNLYNITNAKYWIGANSDISLYPGNPTSFRLNINYLIE